MKYVYILLLYLPSGFGDLTQKMTHYKYTHVALSLNDSYEHFYAFSRLRYNTPPISGYIEEKRIYYTLGKNIPISTKIFKVPVTEEGYEEGLKFLQETANDPEIMYNLINMLLIPIFGGRACYKAYDCGEFIAKYLEKCGIELLYPYYKYIPKLFSEQLDEYVIFEGCIENSGEIDPDDNFFLPTSKKDYVFKSLYILRELIHRQIFKRSTKHFDGKKVRLP